MVKNLPPRKMIVSKPDYRFLHKILILFISLIALAPFNELKAQSSTCEPGSVNNGNNDPWSVECYLNSVCNEQGNPCTANDVNLIGSFLADASGNPIGTFPPGATIEVYLWGRFNNGTSTDRYAVRTDTELWIDGMFVEDVNNCSFDVLPPGTFTAIVTGPFFFQSGQQIELRNTWIGWETSSGAQCSDPGAPNYRFRCGQYSPSKCSKTYDAIPLLVPNFNFSCGDITLNTTQVCFQDLTTGGIPPYTYLWNFGDGNTSTLQAPCHIYNSTTETYTVTLSVLDSEGNTATSILIVDLDNLICPEPSLNVQKIANPATFSQAGEVITYTITVENTGNVVISQLIVEDPSADQPPVYVSGDSNNNNVLDFGEVWLYSASYTITPQDVANGSFTNVVTVDGTPNGGVLEPASDEATVDLIGLRVSKTADVQTYAAIDDVITYTIVIENISNLTISDIIVDDPLISAITNINIGSLAPGGKFTFTETYEIVLADLQAGSVNNTVTVIGNGPNNEEVFSTDNETVTALWADLSVSKSGNPNPVFAGNVITYTIQVNNQGPDEAQNVIITDAVPASVLSPTFSIDGGTTWNEWTGSYEYGNLASGSNFVLLLSGVVDPATQSIQIENTVTVSSDIFDPNPNNNSDTEITGINISADLSITKVESENPAVAGEELIYTLTITNLGPSNAQSVQVSDNVPSALLTPEFSTDNGQSWAAWSSPYALGTLETGDTFVVLIRGTLNPALANNTLLTNTATVSSSTPDPNLVNNTSTIVTTVERKADLSVVKSQVNPATLPAITVIDPSQAVPGTKIYYLLVVENFGPSYATNAVVTDNLPAGISNTQFSLNLGNSWFDWDGTRELVNFEFPGINQILIRGDLDPALTGTITNTATITSDTPDPNPDNNEDSVETLLTPVADLAIIKEVVGGAVAINQTITYRLTIDNNGPSTATDIIVEDIIDTDLIEDPEYSFDNQAPWTPWPVGNQLNVGSLAPFAAEIELFIRGTLIDGIPDPDDPNVLKVSNTATVDSPVFDPNTDNNISTIITTLDVEADLELVKTGPATVIAGNMITYTLTVTNLSTQFDSENVVVEDVVNTTIIISPEYSFNGTDWFSWPVSNVLSLGTIGSTASVTFYIRGQVAPNVSGAIINTAEVFSSTPDPDITNDKDSWTTQVIREADLEIVKLQIDPSILPLDENNLPADLQELSIDPMEIVAGETIYYLLVYTNYGPSDATNVIITDDVPAVIEDVEASRCQANFAPYSGESNLGTVVSGGRCILVIRGTVNAGATGVITNTASITSDVTDPDPNNNESTIVTQIVGNADLLIQKTSSPNPVTAGELITYTLTVTNLGPSDAFDVWVFDEIDERILDPEYFDGDDWVSWPGFLNYGDLPDGDNFSFQIRGTVNPSVPQTNQIVNVATVTSTLTNDPNPNNNTSTATNSVNRFADLKIVKSADPDPVIPGQTLTYTIVVENLGPSDAANVAVTENVPAGLSSINVTPSTGTWTAPIWTVGNMPAGSTQTMTITAVVDELPDGTIIVNTASVTSGTNDPDPENNISTVTSTVTASPQISLSKTADKTANVQAGETITYTYVVTNTGNVVMNNIILSDDHSGSGTLSAFSPEPPVALLAVGASVTFTATYVVTQQDINLQNDIVNTATATATYAGNNYSSSDNETVVLVASEPLVVITKNGLLKLDIIEPNDVANAGDEVIYTFIVKNDGNVTLYDVAVSDPLPGITIQNNGFIGTMLPGDEVTLIGSYILLQTDIDAGVISNTATVNAEDPQGNPVSDSDNDIHNLPASGNIDLLKAGTFNDESGDGFAQPGETITYNFTVTNTGNVTISNLVINDANVGVTNLVVVPSTLLPGENGAASISYTITQEDVDAGGVYNLAVATGQDPNGVPVEDQSSDPNPLDPNDPNYDPDCPDCTFTELPQEPGIAITKTADPKTYAEGDLITYTIVVENTGNVTLSNIVVDDPLLPAITSVNIGILAPGATYTLTGTYITTGTDMVNASVVNVATVSTTFNNIQYTGSDEETITAIRADLAITKTGPNTVTAGEVITYTITVNNIGPDTAENVTITDEVPVEIINPVFSTDNFVNSDPWISPYLIGDLASGQSFSFQIRGTVNNNTPVGTIISNTVIVGSDTFDHVPGNNTSTKETDVNTSADLEIVKTVSSDPVVAGTAITYTLTVTNYGTSDAQAVQVSDIVPAGILNPTFSDDGGATWNPWSSPYVYGALEAGGSFSLQITGVVNPALANNTLLTNTTTVSSSTPDPDPDNNTSTVTTTVVRQADLSVVKSQVNPATLPAITVIDPSQAVPGTKIYYLLVVENFGPSYATNAVVTDNLPAGISNTQFSLNLGNSWFDWDGTRELVNFEFPGINQILIRGDLDPALTGTITNTATITSDTPDPNPDNNEDSVETLLTPVADLAIIKEVVGGAVAINQTITYRLTIDNNGPSTATDIIVEDIIDTDLIEDPEYSFDNQAPWTPWPVGNQLNVGSLAPFAAEIELFIRGTLIDGIPDPDDPNVLKVSNTATVDSPVFDPNTDNNISTIITTLDVEADLELVKTGPATVIAGNMITYTLTVTNLSTQFDSENVVVEDVVNTTIIISPEYSFNGTDWFSWPVSNVLSLGTIGSTASVTFYIRGQVAPNVSGAIINTAEVFSSTPDPDITNDKDSWTTQVIREADLEIVKLQIDPSILPLDENNLPADLQELSIDPMEIVAGETIYYLLVYTNYGPSDATNVIITDDVPAVIEDVEASRCQANFAPYSGESNLGTVVSGGRCILVIRGTVNAGATGVITNTASITSDVTDPDPNNNESTIVTQIVGNADLLIQKTSSPNPVTAGELITYTLTVTNLGPSDAFDVWVFDEIDERILDPEYFDGDDWVSWPGFLNYGDLPDGDNFSFQIRGTVNPSVPQTNQIVNVATVTSTLTNDPNPNNNTSTATNSVNRFADLKIVKSADPDPVIPGQTLTYTIVVENLGPSDAANVAVTENVPAGLSSINVTPSTGTWTAPIWTVGNMPAGSTQTMTITAVVDELPDGTIIVNTASVTSGTNDPDPENNISTVTSTVTASPQISLSKTADKTANVQAGETITYTYVVTNTGNVVMNNIILSDDHSGSGTLSAFSPEPPVALLAVGASVTFTATYVVTQEDIDNQLAISNLATATATFAGDEYNATDVENVTPVAADPSIALVKTGEYLGDPQSAEVNDQILYTFIVTNTGNVSVSGLVIDDVIVGASGLVVDPSALAPGEVGTVTLLYSITQTDINAGQVVNSALATGSDPQGGTVTDTSGTAIDNDTPTTTDLPQDPSITINKSATLINGMVPDPFAYSQVGDVISYTFVVKNTGNVTLNNVTIDDEKVIDLLPASIALLAPGATATFTATYEVGLSDILAGTVENTATAEAEAPNGNPVSSDPDTEIVPAKPTAIDDQENTSANTPVDGNVSTNDLYPVGSVFAVVNPPANGTITNFNPVTGEFTYQPGLDFTGTDTFTYSVCFNFEGFDYCDEATVTITVVSDCITIETWVYLEGSAINQGGLGTYTLPMRTSLNNLRLLPGQSFFDPLFGSNYTPAGQPYNMAPWNYNGNEGDAYDSGGVPGKAGYPSTVVDWVLVSLRTDADGSNGPVCQAAALLHNDGRVEFVESFSCCGIVPGNSYYIVIEHRNHLLVMSHEAVELQSSDGINFKLSYDFRSQQSYINDIFGYGYVGQKQVLTPAGNVYMMFGGNGEQSSSPNSDTDINFNDRSAWESENSIIGRYKIGDYNMNGDTNFNDRILWELNNGKTTSVPRN